MAQVGERFYNINLESNGDCTLGPVQTPPSFSDQPNLIHWIKYMKSSAFESISNAYFASGLTKTSIFLLLNLVQLASESI